MSSLPQYKFNVKIPLFVISREAAALYEFIVTGKPEITKYFDKKNQDIFDLIVHLKKVTGYVDSLSLIDYVKSYGEREGLTINAEYINEVLGGYICPEREIWEAI